MCCPQPALVKLCGNRVLARQFRGAASSLWHILLEKVISTKHMNTRFRILQTMISCCGAIGNTFHLIWWSSVLLFSNPPLLKLMIIDVVYQGWNQRVQDLWEGRTLVQPNCLTVGTMLRELCSDAWLYLHRQDICWSIQSSVGSDND